MAWQQGQSYSEDLRAQVLAWIDDLVGGVFRVRVSHICDALIRRRRNGKVSENKRCGHRPRELTPKPGVAAHIARTSPWRRCKLGWRASTRCG